MKLDGIFDKPENHTFAYLHERLQYYELTLSSKNQNEDAEKAFKVHTK